MQLRGQLHDTADLLPVRIRYDTWWEQEPVWPFCTSLSVTEQGFLGFPTRNLSTILKQGKSL